MKGISNDVYQKVQEVLFTDKIKAPSKISKVLSSELYYVLEKYFEIASGSFNSKIFTQNDGEISISFSFRAKRVLIKRGACVLE